MSFLVTWIALELHDINKKLSAGQPQQERVTFSDVLIVIAFMVVVLVATFAVLGLVAAVLTAG